MSNFEERGALAWADLFPLNPRLEPQSKLGDRQRNGQLVLTATLAASVISVWPVGSRQFALTSLPFASPSSSQKSRFVDVAPTTRKTPDAELTQPTRVRSESRSSATALALPNSVSTPPATSHVISSKAVRYALLVSSAPPAAFRERPAPAEHVISYSAELPAPASDDSAGGSAVQEIQVVPENIASAPAKLKKGLQDDRTSLGEVENLDLGSSTSAYGSSIDQSQRIDAGTSFQIPLLINGTQAGALTLLIPARDVSGEDPVSHQIYMRMADLVDVVSSRMDPKLVEQILASPHADNYISLNDLRAHGMSVSFDNQDRLTLHSI